MKYLRLDHLWKFGQPEDFTQNTDVQLFRVPLPGNNNYSLLVNNLYILYFEFVYKPFVWNSYSMFEKGSKRLCINLVRVQKENCQQ